MLLLKICLTSVKVVMLMVEKERLQRDGKDFLEESTSEFCL